VPVRGRVRGWARLHRAAGELVTDDACLPGDTSHPERPVLVWFLTGRRPRVSEAAARAPGRPTGSTSVHAIETSAALASPAPRSPHQPPPHPASPASLPGLLAVPEPGPAGPARRSRQGAAPVRLIGTLESLSIPRPEGTMTPAASNPWLSWHPRSAGSVAGAGCYGARSRRPSNHPAPATPATKTASRTASEPTGTVPLTSASAGV
jgi:hypothetical protein